MFSSPEKITKYEKEIEEKVKKLLHYKKAFTSKQEKIGESGIPVEIYDVDGSRIRLRVDTYGNFIDEDEAYVFLPKEDTKVSNPTFSTKELIYMVANPVAGRVYGLSPLETLYLITESAIASKKLNKDRINNDGMISGILSVPGLPKSKLRKLFNYWTNERREPGNRLLITGKKDLSFTPMSNTPKDMEFMEYLKWCTSQIMQVYGMQPVVLGIIDGTTGKLNSKEQRRQYFQDAIAPLLDLESYKLTDVLVHKGFGFDDLKIVHVTPKKALDETNAMIGETLAKLEFTKNEIRGYLGYDALEEGGNEPVGSVNQLPQQQDSFELNSIKERLNNMIEEF